MRVETDVKARTASLTLPKKLYSVDAVRIAAHIFDTRAEASLKDAGSSLRLTLTAKKKTVAAEDLERLGGEVLNELLNQEYRFIVGRFNQKIASLTVTQTLFSARGGETPPAPPAGESTPEFMAETERLMGIAREEISRTMPKRIAPQGNPLPPASEEAGA